MNYDASNARKVPFGLSLNQFAQRKIADAVAQLGGQLPCQVVSVAGQIVTVSFDVAAAPFTLPQVSMPIAAWIYDWIPVRAGDQGLTVASDVFLGGVSGLGSGSANLSRPGNLAALVFLPVANAAWTAPGGDPAMRVVQGPDGVLVQDLSGAVVGTFSKSGGVTLSFGGGTITVASGGMITCKLGSEEIVVSSSGVTVGPNTTIDNHVFLQHTHSGVQVGGGTTGPVV